LGIKRTEKTGAVKLTSQALKRKAEGSGVRQALEPLAKIETMPRPCGVVLTFVATQVEMTS